VTLTKPVEAEDWIDQSANSHLLSAPINNAPVKNRNAIKVVARRQATFKAGPATQIDDSL
jgi:hypothetical protein